jgi:hypothetical protein
MNLSIRTLVVRISTANGAVGTRLDFDQKLNVIHAPNTMGKSICVNAIIYALGLEGMLSASHEAPFPSAMTDSVMVGEESLSVLSSEVLLEIVNEGGEAATIRRSLAGRESKNLVSVWNGLTVSGGGEIAVQKDYFVRVAGASQREAGFHYWLANFIGWKLPLVPTFNDDEVPLYLECILPLCIIEQKRGWAGFLSRIPTYLRIRDVAERSVEFLLALDTYQNSIARQRLREEQSRLRTEWQKAIAAISASARLINGVVNGISTEPASLWPPQPAPQLVVPEGDRWISARQALQRGRATLLDLQAKPAPAAADRVEQLQSELRSAEQLLRRDEYALDEYWAELNNARPSVTSISAWRQSSRICAGTKTRRDCASSDR